MDRRKFLQHMAAVAAASAASPYMMRKKAYANHVPVVNLVSPDQQMITDVKIRGHLEKMQVNPDTEAIFKYDYSGDFPKSKRYQITAGKLKGAHITCMSGGRRFRGDDNTRIEVGWNYENGLWVPKNNSFRGAVDGNSIHLFTNEPPLGMTTGDYIAWDPKLYLNGKEVPSVGSWEQLAIDPDNVNYQGNVLRLQYGICFREVRIIQGLMLERWVFSENPNGDVMIKHNKSGRIPMRLGGGRVVVRYGDEEWISREVFDEAESSDNPGDGYPMQVFGETTFYTTEDEEDGESLWDTSSGNWWATARVSAHFVNNTMYMWPMRYSCWSVSGKWLEIFHQFISFDTSSIAPEEVIAADLTVYGSDQWGGVDKYDAISPDIALNATAGTPNSYADIVTGDAGNHGDVPMLDSDITYAQWSPTGAENKDLNAAGMEWIDTGGITCFCLLDNPRDIQNNEQWQSNATCYCVMSVRERGDAYRPTLIVTSAVPGPDAVVGDIDGSDIGAMGDIEGSDIGKIGDI